MGFVSTMFFLAHNDARRTEIARFIKWEFYIPNHLNISFSYIGKFNAQAEFTILNTRKSQKPEKLFFGLSWAVYIHNTFLALAN